MHENLITLRTALVAAHETTEVCNDINIFIENYGLLSLTISGKK